jgi:hypothetical protein
MTLGKEDFETWYKTAFDTDYVGNIQEVELLLELYLGEISAVIPIEKAGVTKIYTFDACGQFYLACPTWQDYTVRIGAKKDTTNLTELSKNKDFLEQLSHTDDTKIIGLDFSCLRCNCECEVVEISGKFGYKLPDIFIKMIFKLVASFYPSDGSTGPCCEENGKVLTSVRTGSVTKSYQIVDIEDMKLKTQLKNGYGICQYEPVKNYLRRYKTELIII